VTTLFLGAGRSAVYGLLVLALVASCNSTHSSAPSRSVESEPPVIAIELTRPASTAIEQGAVATFPAGTYHRAAYEDKRGDYFEAPDKILVDDVAVYAYEGGIYLPRGKTAAPHWYIIKPNGQRSMGRFKSPPSYRVIEH
jgi:hypothetical protein